MHDRHLNVSAQQMHTLKLRCQQLPNDTEEELGTYILAEEDLNLGGEGSHTFYLLSLVQFVLPSDHRAPVLLVILLFKPEYGISWNKISGHTLHW